MCRIPDIKIMSSIKNTLLLVLLTSLQSLYGQPVTWDSSTSYSTGALVVVIGETSTYIATQSVPANNSPPNTTYWTNLSVAATALNVPVEDVPSLDIATILASLPNAAPDANSTGGGSSSTSKFKGIAARGLVSSSQPMFGGIIISGNEDKKIAFMGKGQSMGVSPYAADPILEIWSTSGKLSENDNWGTITDAVSSNLSTVSSDISVPASTAEAGMVMTLSPGSYSFVLKSKSGTLSGAMIEAYEVDSSASRFKGIAARGLVSSSQPMFGGIIITGSEDKKIAFMGKGESMGVSPYAADPILEIWSTSGKLSENDNWGTITDAVSSNLSTVSSDISAPTSTAEAGMVMTLSPGSYSFVLKSKSGTLSGAMIEAYEVD